MISTPTTLTADELPNLYSACLAADQAERRAIETTDFSEQDWARMTAS